MQQELDIPWLHILCIVACPFPKCSLPLQCWLHHQDRHHCEDLTMLEQASYSGHTMEHRIWQTNAYLLWLSIHFPCRRHAHTKSQYRSEGLLLPSLVQLAFLVQLLSLVQPVPLAQLLFQVQLTSLLLHLQLAHIQPSKELTRVKELSSFSI